MAAANESTVLGPGEGQVLTYPRGGQMTLKARAAETGGAYALLEFTIPRGGTGSPPHFHVATEEAFYVLEGELTFTLGDRPVRAIEGSFIFVPRGAVHMFQNTGSGPARCLILVSPGDFEGYFVELGELTSSTPGEPPDPAALVRIARKYGQEFVEPPPGPSGASALAGSEPGAVGE